MIVFLATQLVLLPIQLLAVLIIRNERARIEILYKRSLVRAVSLNERR